MTLDENWAAYRDRLRAQFGIAVTDDWLAIATAHAEREAVRKGQLRYGGRGDWFRSIRWSPAAWTALHGTGGPRGRG